MNNPLLTLDPGLAIWTIVTFLVLFALLAKFAWKPILAFLAVREEAIKTSLENAQTAKKELDRLQQDPAISRFERWLEVTSPILASIAMVLAHTALQRSSPNARLWWVLAALEVAIAAQILSTILLIGVVSREQARYAPWATFISICGYAVATLAGRFALFPPNPNSTNSLYQRAMIWRA